MKKPTCTSCENVCAMRCLQWLNARLYSVLFDVAPWYWKSLCKIPCAQNSWRYESVDKWCVLTKHHDNRATMTKAFPWHCQEICLDKTSWQHAHHNNRSIMTNTNELLTVTSDRIAGKWMNIKKIKLYLDELCFRLYFWYISLLTACSCKNIVSKLDNFSCNFSKCIHVDITKEMKYKLIHGFHKL